jgi:hypothetical protein
LAVSDDRDVSRRAAECLSSPAEANLIAPESKSMHH